MKYLKEPERTPMFLCDEGGCRHTIEEEKLQGSDWTLMQIGGMAHCRKHYCKFHRPTLSVFASSEVTP